jgi:hypothetical protein
MLLAGSLGAECRSGQNKKNLLRDFFILPSITAYLSGVQFLSNIWGVAQSIA